MTYDVWTARESQQQTFITHEKRKYSLVASLCSSLGGGGKANYFTVYCISSLRMCGCVGRYCVTQ